MLQNICDEFVCALRKRVLLQGRLYICEHFICFHSSLFGYNKEKVISLKVTPAPSGMMSCFTHAWAGDVFLLLIIAYTYIQADQPQRKKVPPHCPTSHFWAIIA